MTSPLKENSMGANVTTPRQASVAYWQLGLTTRLALADSSPHGFLELPTMRWNPKSKAMPACETRRWTAWWRWKKNILSKYAKKLELYDYLECIHLAYNKSASYISFARKARKLISLFYVSSSLWTCKHAKSAYISWNNIRVHLSKLAYVRLSLCLNCDLTHLN